MKNITIILNVKFIIMNYNFGDKLNLEYLGYALNQI
jgi:hypothetical protein